MAKEEELGAKALAGVTPATSTSKGGDPVSTDSEEPTPEEVQLSVEERVARLAQVLDRGILNDKLARIAKESVPEGRRGKFVRDTVDDTTRYSNLGFSFEVKSGAQGMHLSADGRVRAGDLVLMTISEEDYNILRMVKQKKVKQHLAAGRQIYKRDAQRSAPGVEVYDESHTTIG